MNFIPKIEYTDLTSGVPKSFTFDSPPEGDPFEESLRPVARARRSTGGKRQVQSNYNLKQYRLRFLFQTQATYDDFREFVANHAFRGGDFKYFIHSDEVDFEVFEMDIRRIKFERPIPAATVGEFEYDFRFTIERAE